MKNWIRMAVTCGVIALIGWGCANGKTATKQGGFAKNEGPIQVEITTSFGIMIAELFDDTPVHRDNFAKLVREGFYDGLIFHRVIQGFMIQGGDPNSRGATPGTRLGSGGPGYTLEAEIDTSYVHVKGALSAARQGDTVNPEKRSSGSQFYIVQGATYSPNKLASFESRLGAKVPGFSYTDAQKEAYSVLGGTPHLDMEYTVFGQVVEGLDVIDSIASVQTARGDRPLEDVIMNMRILD